MKTYTPDELKAILVKHAAYLRGEAGGERANLSGANLSGANLYGADLSGANLYGANLSRANLSGANLYGAYLSGAYLSGADLSRANLSDANLSRANLSRANLSGAVLDDKTRLPDASIVPESGPFVGYKKLTYDIVAELYVPRSAQRIGGLLGRKCRVSKAKVKALWHSDGTPITDTAVLIPCKHDETFAYSLGAWINMAPGEQFNADIREVCTAGIHLFITRKEAEEY